MKFRIGQYVTFCDGTIAKITNIKEKNIYVTVNGKEEPCSYYECDIFPITIADKIRSMTDEELAKFITEDRWDCNDCPSGQENMDNPFGGRCDNKCAEHCLEWLRKESS